MKKALEKTTELFHYKDGKKVLGKHEDLRGNCSGLRGNCSGLSGDCSYLWGYCSDLRGNCSDLRGDCSGLRGNLDECDITEEDRKRGVNIQSLIKEA